MRGEKNKSFCSAGWTYGRRLWKPAWTVVAALLVALSVVHYGAVIMFAAQFDESTGVNTRRGDPSPTAAESNLDDYTFQDEQINLAPDSGVVKVLRVNQKNLINDYVTEMIPCRNVSVREIRHLMRQVCGAEGGRAEVVRDKNQKEYFIQVICPRFQLPYLREAIAALDQPWVRYMDDGASVTYYTARFRDIRAVDRLATIWAGDGESQIDLARNAVLRWDEPYRVKEYRTQGVVMVDIPVNQVLLDLKIYEINVTNDIKLGLDYIAWKNGPGRNLAELIAAGMENREHFANASSIYNPVYPRVVNPGPRDLHLTREFATGQYHAFANYLMTSAYLDFLVSKGRAKTLAATQLLATSGQGRNAGTSPARFEAVDDIAGFEIHPNDAGVETGTGARPTRLATTMGQLIVDGATSRAIRDDDGNPTFTYSPNPITVDTPVHSRTLQYGLRGKTGLFFEVIPHVALDACELEIVAGASSLAGTGPDGLPILAQRTISAQISVPNGQPIVLSGLSRVTRVHNNARMPILGKIPILGYVFGGEMGVQRETQVVFILTPTIIAASDSAVTLGHQAREAIARVKGEIKTMPPRHPLGFDQWLLGEE
ncbi:MAG: type II and III secretion system protein [Candidatus Sumerlaeia bacterium]|nr:type II and III secretion system protein [Candidatus Sumerlaeia bacterium]